MTNMPGRMGPGDTALPGMSARWTTASLLVGLGAPSTRPSGCRFVSHPLSKSQASLQRSNELTSPHRSAREPLLGQIHEHTLSTGT